MCGSASPGGTGEGAAHQRFTRNTCSISCRISSSLKTLRTSSLSMHCCLFMYFMAYIFSVSLFCTMHTWAGRGKQSQEHVPHRHLLLWEQKPTLLSTSSPSNMLHPEAETRPLRTAASLLPVPCPTGECTGFAPACWPSVTTAASRA